MPAVVPLEDDRAATAEAPADLEMFAPHQACVQQQESLEVDLDVGETRADVFVDLAQPLADVEPIEPARRGAAFGADEIAKHEERGERGGLEPALGGCDERLGSPVRVAAGPGGGGNIQPSPQCSKAVSREAGEFHDHLGAHLEAQKPFGEREYVGVAVDHIAGRR